MMSSHWPCVTSVACIQKAREILTSRCGHSSTSLPGSAFVVPMTKSPDSTLTKPRTPQSSGQLSRVSPPTQALSPHPTTWT